VAGALVALLFRPYTTNAIPAMTNTATAIIGKSGRDCAG
jgi:hypothetical protein